MATCKWCGKSGWLLKVSTNGMCERCEATETPNLQANLSILKEDIESLVSEDDPEERLLKCVSIIAVAGMLLPYEEKGIPLCSPPPSEVIKHFSEKEQEFREDYLRQQEGENLKKEEGATLSDIGELEPTCPYCSNRFPKMPARKTKCRACGGYVYSRTRPSDQKKVLLREEDLEVLEELWAIKKGTHAEFKEMKARRESARQEFVKRTGKKPLESDITWRLMNEDLNRHSLEQNWGRFRMALFQMGEQLRTEKREESALTFYLEVCYVDLNGPNDIGGVPPEYLHRSPPFRPEVGLIAPGVLRRCKRLAASLGWDLDQVKSRFIEKAEWNHEHREMPISPEVAWKDFWKAWEK